MYANVAFPLPLPQLFTYKIPDALIDRAKPGMRVNAPFGKKQLIGVIHSLQDAPPERKIKEIHAVLDPVPVLSDQLRTLLDWVAEYYMAPPGECYKLALPHLLSEKRVKPKMVSMLRYKEAEDVNVRFSKRQESSLRLIKDLLQKTGGSLSVARVKQELGITDSLIKALAAKGAIEVTRVRQLREYFPAHREPERVFNLTAHQLQAIESINIALKKREFSVIALDGVTGSGKTQVYIEVLRTIFAQGGNGIVLVPEISLTPQMTGRFVAAFGDEVTTFHSRLSEGQRADIWDLILSGKKKIVVGPRSALFAPFPQTSIIIVDEEHESSYKQFESAPLYHARDTAIMRGFFDNSVVVLGSATLSLETVLNVRQKKYQSVFLPERVDNATLPEMVPVDMREERASIFNEMKEIVREAARPFPRRLPSFSLSRRLVTEIESTLERNEGTILFLNRRGYSHTLACDGCGKVMECSRCALSLTYHLGKKRLICHYCGYSKNPPPQCPHCDSSDLRYTSFGTQQVAEELRDRVPQARVLRIDADTTSAKNTMERMLASFARKEADILLGTQMVAKGLDFPHVTLVGVINADSQLHLPDFRSSERTFQLIVQVAGRAGRSDLRGRVIVQTSDPSHSTLAFALRNDITGFQEYELNKRNSSKYPPFHRLVLLEFTSVNKNAVEFVVTYFAGSFRRHQATLPTEIVGPFEAPIEKLAGKFRMHCLARVAKNADPSGKNLRSVIRSTIQDVALTEPALMRKVNISIDVDPLNIM